MKVLRKAEALNVHHWAAALLQIEKIKKEKLKKNGQVKTENVERIAINKVKMKTPILKIFIIYKFGKEIQKHKITRQICMIFHKGTAMAIFVYVVVLFFSAIIHEVAHGYVAYLRGDDTAKTAGRITLNPIPHIELFGTILLPAMLLFLKVPVLLGWAKPVPLNYKNLKDPRKDVPLICLAGPASNIMLAFLSGLVMHAVRYFPNFELSHNHLIEYSLHMMIVINVVLAVINLIPVPPFDGSKIVTYFLPEKIVTRYLNLNPYICLIVLYAILSSKIVWKFIYSIVNFFVAAFRIIAF